MRLHRLILNHFRGVESREIQFSTDAINLIVGPNESGKTTVIEALETVLTVKATAKSQRVKELQPIGRDVSPEVTVEFSVGPHRITLRKRWLKKNLTEARIQGPAPRQLQGEEAHQAVLSILNKEMDWPLFLALLLRQSQESTALPRTPWSLCSPTWARRTESQGRDPPNRFLKPHRRSTKPTSRQRARF